MSRNKTYQLVRVILLITFGALTIASSCERELVKAVADPNPFYRLMFYNVENLFDTIDDPQTQDEDFTPDGSYHWTKDRLENKLDKITKVIKDLGGDTLPVLIGLCEIENRAVLDRLIYSNGFDGLGYKVVHHESPDYRGIDVALLYREPWFTLISSGFYPVWFPFDTATRTREVLYAKGILAQIDTIHIFVNHWPSRSGGEIESRPKRIFVAEMLRSKVDSILAVEPRARIIITGDFNDEPQDLSVVSGLNALHEYNNPKAHELYDLTGYIELQNAVGSYRYRGDWNYLDNVVVSGALLDTTAKVYCRVHDHQVYHPDYLEEKDPDYLGNRPFRTYLGPVYHGGYSDHFPVYLNLRYRSK